jgi:hypothetical protein
MHACFFLVIHALLTPPDAAACFTVDIVDRQKYLLLHAKIVNLLSPPPLKMISVYKYATKEAAAAA